MLDLSSLTRQLKLFPLYWKVDSSLDHREVLRMFSFDYFHSKIRIKVIS